MLVVMKRLYIGAEKCTGKGQLLLPPTFINRAARAPDNEVMRPLSSHSQFICPPRNIASIKLENKLI